MPINILFTATLFLGAFLLFSIQPMVAKSLLPVYGGTPAVWTICMLFFQLSLLLAYGYVWILSFLKRPLFWRSLHLIVLALSLYFLPVFFHSSAQEHGPEWSILHTLLSQIGLPVWVLAASAPLVQFAYSQTQSRWASDPYFLYIASNLGSLMALLLYPFVMERTLGLSRQFYWWNRGYFIYLALVLVVFFTSRYQALQTAKSQVRLPWKLVFTWVLYSFVPCSLMLGLTFFITTDVAATPLFWVVPLALYLLSFALGFKTKPFFSLHALGRVALVAQFLTVISLFLGAPPLKAWQIILINLASFFVTACFCHSFLFLERPKPQLLTLFYFCLAVGGVLAGMFNGLVAPHCFHQLYEYPLAIALALLLLPRPSPRRSWLTFTTLSFLGVYLVLPMLPSKNNLLQDRSFYAVNKVEDRNGIHVFISQSTVHGLQDMAEKKPLNGYRSYYGAIQPVVETLKQEHPSLSVTMMGLGTGTMLCQLRTEDQVQAIEIDQQVIDIAKNTQLFTYLKDCLPKTLIIKKDGRLALAEFADASQDLLVLDAFNSDAVPVHLMTLEAFKMYQRKIKSDGVILVNISNRHLQLLPVIHALGRSLNLMVFTSLHRGDARLGQLDSEWALLTTNEGLAFQIMNNKGWRFLAEGKQLLWTDDYSNIVSLFRI